MQEFADFLGSQPPFDELSADDLARLACRVEVEYFDSGTVIVPAGSDPLDHLYVVRTGAVEIVDRGRAVDLLGPGDTFGHISVLTGLAPALSARAAEDTVCYRLPDPRNVVTDPAALRFSHFGTMIAKERLTGSGLLSRPQTPIARYMRAIVWCDASTPVREAAEAVTRAGQSCALIRTPQGIGIVTDRDFRSKVATVDVSVDAPVNLIMSKLVNTVPSTMTLATAFAQMVKSGVHHLVVQDEDAAPIGILRAMDLASVEVRDPLLIRTAIDAAADISELIQACRFLPPTMVELHDTGVPADHIGALLAALTDAVLSRANWRDARYCAIDVETTGLDLRRDSMVSIGSVGIHHDRIVCSDSYYSLIRPTCPVSVASIRIHYLRPADLEGAPTAREVGQEIARQLAGRIVVAHAARIERAFLSKLLRQVGIKFDAPVIDTAALARALGYAQGNPDGREPSLELLARRLSLPVYQPHHALGDAITTAAVFLALASKAEKPATRTGSEPLSAQSLVALSAKYAY